MCCVESHSNCYCGIVVVVYLSMIFVAFCALAVLYWLGLYISTGISLWRLVRHHYYGNTDGCSNLEPSLYILYSVAVAQGVLFRFRSFYSCTQRNRIMNQVKQHYDLSKIDLVLSYVKETKARCKKDLQSFPDGRWNLVTYAMDLLRKSERPEKHVSDVRAVFLTSSTSTKQQRPLKQLMIGNESFSPMISKLLQMMHPKSQYSRETRENAAGIVAVLADQINLEEFSGGVQSILSLLDTSEEYTWLPERYQWDYAYGLEEEPDQGDWLLQIQKIYELGEQEVPEGELLTEYSKMFLQGLCIFAKLAYDKDNCRVISNTEGLVSRITAPLLSSRLHNDHHEEWTSIAAETLALLFRFMVTPGESGEKLRNQIIRDGQATIRALQGILVCDTCRGKSVLQAFAIEILILLDLSSLDTSSIMACTRRSGVIILELLRIFLRGYTSDELKLLHKLYNSTHWMKKRCHIRNLASEQLVRLCSKSKISATVILQAGGESTPALRELTNTLVGAKNTTYRIRAAEILEHLCSSYTNDDSYLKSLKEALLNAVPKVLTEILGCGSTGAYTQAEAENQPRYSAADADLEDGPSLPDNEQSNIHSSHWQNCEEHGDTKLQEALLPLCETVCQKWIGTDPDLARRFDEIATKICSEQRMPVVPFTLLVEEAGEILKKNG